MSSSRREGEIVAWIWECRLSIWTWKIESQYPPAYEDVERVMVWGNSCPANSSCLLHSDSGVHLLVYPICTLLHPLDWQYPNTPYVTPL